MPTTQPLDDELGDFFEGPLKSIAVNAENVTDADAEKPVRKNEPSVSSQPAATPKATDTPQVGKTVTAAPGTSMQGNLKFSKLRTPSMGLNNDFRQTASTDTSAVSAQPSGVNNDKAYTDNDVLNAWSLFIENNKAEHLLTNAMRVATPVRLSDHTFRVAQSEIHLNYINENLNRITEFVRTRVGNSNITFVLEKVSKESPLVWNERELLQHMVEQNPSIKPFISQLNLKLI